jgi:predicted transcriptional regulator
VLTAVTRVHYEIDDRLHREVKALAATEGKTLKQVVEDALREYVDRHTAKKR